MMLKIRRRLAEMVWVSGGMAVSRVFTLVASVIAARLLGVEEFGRFTLFLTIALLIADMSRPVDNAYVREASGRDDAAAASFLRFAVYLKLGLIAGMTAAWLSVSIFGPPSFATMLNLIGAALVAGSLWTVSYSLQANFQRRQQFRKVGMIDPLATSSVLAAMGLASLAREFTVQNVIVWILLLSVLIATANALLILRWTKRSILPGAERKKFLSLIWIFFSSGALLQVAGRLDTFLVAAMMDMRALGYYGAAARVVGPVGMLGAGAGMLLLPVARRAYESQAGLADYIRRSVLYNVVQLAVLFLLLSISDQLVSWLFGDQYEMAGAILRWLLLARILNAFTVPFRVLLQAGRRPAGLLRVAMVRIIVGTAGIALLVPQLGGIGAALGLCVGEFVTLCVTVLFVRHGWRFEQREV